MTESSDLLIYDGIKKAMHAASARLQDAFQEDGTTLGPMEARCLSYFARNTEGTQSELVRLSGRDKAQIARITKILLGRGLLERQPSAPGTRAARLRITAAGAALDKAAEGNRRRVARQMSRELTIAEKRDLIRLLDVVTDTLAEPQG